MPTLSWLTRDDDLKAAGRAPYRLLQEVPELGYGDPDAGNMLVQGDNLEALKALLPFYAGQVKCIYIDPPYNTGSAFEHYDDSLEHSRWLAMMWPRLELLRELLAEDGSIWVSIDDNEGHYLKVVMDEVFGRKNFVANVVWQKSYTANQTAKHLSDTHDHILLYARTSFSWRLARSPAPKIRRLRLRTPTMILADLGRPRTCQRENFTPMANLRLRAQQGRASGRRRTAIGAAIGRPMTAGWKMGGLHLV